MLVSIYGRWCFACGDGADRRPFALAMLALWAALCAAQWAILSMEKRL
jgi:hypothetical protein